MFENALLQTAPLVAPVADDTFIELAKRKKTHSTLCHVVGYDNQIQPLCYRVRVNRQKGIGVGCAAGK